MSRSVLSTICVAAVNIFILFHLFAIVSWCLPSSRYPVLFARDLVRPYLLWSGLFQSWDMFSPSPKRTNSYVEAMLVYSDGTTEYWPFPRMERLGYVQRYTKERYRKFEEVMIDDKFSDMWPDVCRYVARHAPRPSGPRELEVVTLVVSWSNIEKNADGTFADSPWQSRTIYRYRVEPEDLN
jgi:hypothetical protein